MHPSVGGSDWERGGGNGRRGRQAGPSDRRRQRLVLIVDDLTDQRELYAGYLVYLGYRVEEAAGGVEGIAKAVELQPDLIIMDLAMPGLDGFDATRVLKAVSLTKNIPIVALTAHGEHLPREWATVAGCDMYLRKPILPGDLAAEIDRLLRRRSN
jgi:two-component system, cell cycle response regulator DivK